MRRCISFFVSAKNSQNMANYHSGLIWDILSQDLTPNKLLKFSISNYTESRKNEAMISESDKLQKDQDFVVLCAKLLNKNILE